MPSCSIHGKVLLDIEIKDTKNINQICKILCSEIKNYKNNKNIYEIRKKQINKKNIINKKKEK